MAEIRLYMSKTIWNFLKKTVTFHKILEKISKFVFWLLTPSKRIKCPNLLTEHYQPCFISHVKFGQDPSRNTTWMACQAKISAILCGNQWCVATMMASSWRHSIAHITNYVPSLMTSLVRIHQETRPVRRAKQRKVLFYVEISDV